MQRSVQLLEKLFLESRLRNWTLRTWARLHRVFGEKSPDLPAEVRKYLRRSNPRLDYFVSRYSALYPFDHSMWKGWPRKINLLNFRSESYYVGQFASRWRYLITAAYVDTLDDWGLLYKLPEEGLFGAITFKVLDHVLISRDLLDSILEINFLRHSLRLDPGERYVVLDIGAGYGRFAHRFTAVFPRSYVYCADAVPLSTFLCDFYIRFREFSDQAEAVPLFEVDRLAGKKIDFATNIHSWSECTLSAITYWLGLLTDFRVPFLFVIPHEASFLSMEPDGSRQSFLPEILRHGYKPIIQGNKFGGSKFMQKYGICDAPYFLFELRR